MEFVIHDDIDIAKITRKELLSASKTKALLSNILGNALLEEYKGSKKKVVVVKGTTVQINQPHSLAESMSTHNHEEADTMIPLHVIDAIGDSTLKDIDLWSPGTDELILLMDLVTHGRLGAFTKLNFLTETGDKNRLINIRERVSVIGREKCQGLIGFHNFTGADSGGKFVGSPRTYPCPVMTPIRLCLLTPCSQATRWWTVSFPKTCGLSRSLFDQYTALGGATTTPALRLELFRSRNLEDGSVLRPELH